MKRDKSDDELNATLVRLANAIRGNPDFGLDCELYRSLMMRTLFDLTVER